MTAGRKRAATIGGNEGLEVSDGRERVAEHVRRVRERVRQQGLVARDPTAVLPPSLEARTPQAVPTDPAPEPPPLPPPPDGSSVNEAWLAEPSPRPGLAGFGAGLLERFLRPRHQAQGAFNAKQVQLRQELLGYGQPAFPATPRHQHHALSHVGR